MRGAQKTEYIFLSVYLFCLCLIYFDLFHSSPPSHHFGIPMYAIRVRKRRSKKHYNFRLVEESGAKFDNGNFYSPLFDLRRFLFVVTENYSVWLSLKSSRH